MADTAKLPPVNPAARIEIRFHNLDELFDGMDPAPPHERDLDNDVEEYITASARELPRTEPISVTIVLPPDQEARQPENFAGRALRRFFDYKADMAGREFRELMRRGRISLVIGILFLAACMLVRELLAQAGGTHEYHLAGEAVIIIGWVAMWRPVEILLYDWWPVLRQRKNYERLAKAAVQVRYE